MAANQIIGMHIKDSHVVALTRVEGARHGVLSHGAVHRVLSCPRDAHGDVSIEVLYWASTAEAARSAYTALQPHFRPAQSGRVRNEKPVRNIDTGDVYKSQAEAARDTGLTVAAINHVVAGRRTHAGGYRWEYVSDAELDEIQGEG